MGYTVLKQFETKSNDGDDLQANYGDDNDLFIRINDNLDEVSAAFIFEDNDKDREKAKQLLEVIQSYINKTA